MEYISGIAFTYTQTLKTKNGYIVKYISVVHNFVLYLLNICTVFTIMSLVFCGIPVKCWFDATKYGNIFVDLKINKSTINTSDMIVAI